MTGGEIAFLVFVIATMTAFSAVIAWGIHQTEKRN